MALGILFPHPEQIHWPSACPGRMTMSTRRRSNAAAVFFTGLTPSFLMTFSLAIIISNTAMLVQPKRANSECLSLFLNAIICHASHCIPFAYVFT